MRTYNKTRLQSVGLQDYIRSMLLETGIQRPDFQEKNQLAYSGFRLTLTGGYATDSITPATPNLVISQVSLPGAISEKVQPSIRLVSYPHRRQLPEIKSIDYLMAIWLQPFIKDHGADDVLYQREGIVAECPRSNFFIVMSMAGVGLETKFSAMRQTGLRPFFAAAVSALVIASVVLGLIKLLGIS